MRSIRKNREPASLARYRSQQNATFNDLPSLAKQELRDSLLQEQGYICCYCMSRIKRESMKIEHWHCQSQYRIEQLDYQNILAACPGNAGRPPADQHCDTRKANSDLTFNPTQRDVENWLKYLGDGTIQSTETAFNDEIDEVLNLNFSRLKGNRKNVVEAVRQALDKKPGPRTKSQIKSLISQWDSADNDGRRKEFCAVAIYFLNKRLRRA